MSNNISQYTASDLFPEEENIINNNKELVDNQVASQPSQYTASDLFPEEENIDKQPKQDLINESIDNNIPSAWMEPATEDTAGNPVHPTSDAIVDSGQSLANSDPEQLISSEIAKNVENKMSLPEQNTGPLPYQEAVSNVERQIYGIMETKPDLIVNNPMLSMYENPRQMAEGLITSPIFSAPALRKELGIQLPEYFMEPPAPEDKFLGRMINAAGQSATMGYAPIRPSPAPENNPEAIADVAGNFLGMLLPFGQAMRVGQIGTVGTINLAKKIKPLSKILEQTSKQSPKATRIAKGALANVYGFNLHTQLGADLTEASIIERLETVPESTWHAALFSSAGAMKEFGKLSRIASYPAVGAIGYNLTPNPEDDPSFETLSDEEKAQTKRIAQAQSIASGLMLMSFHRTSSGTRVEGMREYLDAFMPGMSTKAKNNAILKSLQVAAKNPDFSKMSLNANEGARNYNPNVPKGQEIEPVKPKVGKSHQMELFQNIKELKEEIALNKKEQSKKEPTPKEEPAPEKIESKLNLDRDVPDLKIQKKPIKQKPVKKKVQKPKPKIDKLKSKRKIEALLEGVNEPSASYRYNKSVENLKNNKQSYRYDSLVELAKERGVYDSKNNKREDIVNNLIDSYKNPEIKSQKPPKIVDGLKISYDAQGKMKMDIHNYEEVARVAKKIGVYDKKSSRLKLIDKIVRADSEGKVTKDPLPVEKEAEYNLIKENIKNMRSQIKESLQKGESSKSVNIQRKRASMRKAKELADALENKYNLSGLEKTKSDIFPGISLVVDYLRARKKYKDARKPLTDEEIDALHAFYTGKNVTDEQLVIAYTAMQQKPLTKSLGADGLKNVINEIRKVFNPLADIPKEQQGEYLKYRYKFLGQQYKLTKYLEELVSGYKNYTEKDRVLSYLVLTGEADISSIKDPKLKRITQKTRRLFDTAGKGLVKRGQLSQEAYDGLKGQYITRIYLRYMLDKGPQLGGRSKLSKVYNNVRKEMTPEMKAQLGEIRTPELPITVGLTREFGDIAKYDFFKSLAEDGRFVFQPARAEVDGKMMSIGQLQHELSIYRQMLPKAEESQKPYMTEYINKLESKLQEVAETMGQPPENFKQIPIHEGYGPLSGSWVNRAIHDDIVSMFQITEGSEYRNWLDNLNKFEKTATAMWKTGKVAFNPPTVMRNILSNPWQLSMSGMGYGDIVTTMGSAAKKMATNHPDFINAGKNGVFGGTWSQAEIQSILKSMRQVEKEFGTSGDFNLTIRSGFSKVANWYSKVDEFYKFVKYLDGKNKGLSDSEATIDAQKWVMDYSLVSPVVRGLREHFYGVPFVTYQSKVLPLATEAALKRPWTLLMPYLLTELGTQYSLNKFDIDEKSWGEAQMAMGTEMANSKALLLAPFKDEKGRLQVINMEYGLPWEFWVEFGENAINGDLPQLRNNMGVAPIFTAMSAMYTGTIPTQDGGYIELYNSQSTPEEKNRALTNFLWDMSLPSTFGPRGPIANLIEGTTELGKPETTLGQDLSRFTAYTFKPITDEGMQRADKIARAKLSALGKEYALKQNKLIKKSKMTGEVFVETEEYKDLIRDMNVKQMEIYKKHYGPLVIGKWKDGSLKTVESVMDSTQEELIEIFKKIEIKE